MRTRIYQIIEMTDPDDFKSRAFSIFIISLISINVTCIVLESIPSLDAKYRLMFFWVEILSTVIFAIEYALRLWTSVESTSDTNDQESATRKRLRYASTPLAIVDLLAFLPSLLQVLFPGLDLRFLRLLRLLRVFKLTRYFSSFELLLTVLHEERKSLTGIFFIMMVMLTLAASALYLVERDIQPDSFGSIPQAMWWAVAALTTVGYGDVYPISLTGQILGSLVTILGIGMVALPSGILASAFSEQMRRRREALEDTIQDALEDGLITDEELTAIRKVGRNLSMSEEQIEKFVEESQHIFNRDRKA